jgi:membrane protein insertase Oxa1/YidC/SpoIIIJ
MSYVTMRLTPQGDANMKTQRMMMMIAMPLMMFFFTLNISGGVGLYWIAGNVIAIIQQILLMKFYVRRKFGDLAAPGGDVMGKARDKK